MMSQPLQVAFTPKKLLGSYKLTVGVIYGGDSTKLAQTPQRHPVTLGETLNQSLASLSPLEHVRSLPVPWAVNQLFSSLIES